MIKYKIKKSYHFDLGHRFWKDFGWKEQFHLHGHTFILTVEFTATELDKKNSVLDTDEIDKIIKPLIKKLDHSFIFDKEDPLYKEFKEHSWENFDFKTIKIFEIDGQPTYEKILEFIYLQIEKYFNNQNYKLTRLTLKGATNIEAEIEVI